MCKAFPRVTRENTGVFLSVPFLPFTHTIYTLITHKSMRGHSERKALDRFSTIHRGVHGLGWVGLEGFFDPTHHGG